MRNGIARGIVFNAHGVGLSKTIIAVAVLSIVCATTIIIILPKEPDLSKELGGGGELCIMITNLEAFDLPIELYIDGEYQTSDTVKKGFALELKIWVEKGAHTVKILAGGEDPKIEDIYMPDKGVVSVKFEYGYERSPLPEHPETAKSYITPNDQEVQLTLAGIRVEKPLISIRDWVAKNIQYKYDEVQYGREWWQFPRETLSLRSGDCEDMAILLCSLLRAYGFPPENVAVGLGTDEKGVGHAYVMVQLRRHEEVGKVGGFWYVMEPQAGGQIVEEYLSDFLTATAFATHWVFNDKYVWKGEELLKAEKDDDVSWYGVWYDSRDPRYKNPVGEDGAVWVEWPTATEVKGEKVGPYQSVTFRIRVFRNDVTEITLRVWDDQLKEEKLFPMRLEKQEDIYEWWRATIPAPNITTEYFYQFHITDGEDTDLYADNPERDGGVGMMYDDVHFYYDYLLIYS